ncbi:MAG: transposase [Nitrososphaerota archaeon]|nr:transposase [Nitrososphaerota archaeon]MDG6981621.1 transposase [Nitrososphaerota archaeon]MDG6987360.1 transposase [Nitrososphaerota archaeon]
MSSSFPSFYRRLSRRPELFRSFTGLDVSEFDSLRSRVESGYQEHERKRLSRKDRKREFGAGRPFKLSLDDRLLTLLMYYRTYVTSILLGFVVNLDQSNVLKDVRMLEPLVKRVVPLPEKLHEMARRARTPEEVEKFFPGLRAFIDATEHEIPRPKSSLKRRTRYSGKKKRYAVKTQLAVNPDGLILNKTNHARGRRHDYPIFKRNHPSLPEGVRPVVDLDYDGIQNDFAELKPMVPFKRRGKGRGHKGEKGRRLTPRQKAFNRALSKARVVVEHTISRLKKFNIFGTEFRNRLRHYDVMTDIVSGLVNMRILGA